MLQEEYAGMGAIPHEKGVAFRVWAPHCTRVSVTGSFNDWNPEASPMEPSQEGYWYGDVSGAKIGDEYRFHLENGEARMSRIDPYAREVTNSVGNAVVPDKEFDWGEEAESAYHLPSLNELVIYELHIGTFREHVDGLRYDSTLFMRKIDGSTLDIPDAWKLFRTMNGGIRAKLPTKVLIAEDLQDEDALTASIENGGAGFHAQWSSAFVHPVRRAVTEPNDARRSMQEVRQAVEQSFNHNAFQRVIYSESHDEVANGHQRVTSEVQPDDPQAWFARKRSTLAAGLVFTSPGVPMLFQGQEFLETGWFQDTVPLDWDLSEEFAGIVRMYRDLIALRLNRHGNTRGLCGQITEFYSLDEEKNLIAFLRRDRGGPGDDVVVVANFSNQAHEGHRVGFPAPGPWQLRLNSDWTRYDRGFKTPVQPQVEVEEMAWDNLPCSAELILPPYSLIIFSQDPA